MSTNPATEGGRTALLSEESEVENPSAPDLKYPEVDDDEPEWTWGLSEEDVITCKLRIAVGDALRLINQAYEKQIWRTMGYRSFEHYAETEFGFGFRVHQRYRPAILTFLLEAWARTDKYETALRDRSARLRARRQATKDAAGGGA